MIGVARMRIPPRAALVAALLRPVALGIAALLGPALVAVAPAGAASVAAPGAAAAADATSDSGALRNDAIATYNAQNYVKAAQLAARWIDRADAEGKTGREYAAMQFILGHSRYEVHHKEGGRYAGDYRAEVVTPIEESLRVLQDDPAFKNMLLGNAYFELWDGSGRRDAESEGRSQWYLLKSILLRADEVRDHSRSAPEYDLFARHVLFYLERCLDLARSSNNADLYLERIRTVAPWGFGTTYDARFWQIHDLTYFDDGNMKAAALWQRGLDMMRDPKTAPDEALAVFTQAADLTRRKRDRAEVYRQMSDFVSTLDAPERRVQAAEFAKRSFELNPGDGEIRRQYGTALHVLSYAAYTTGKFDDALARAQESITFEWDGMEVAFFDVSRAAAEMGHETEALTHGERAFRMAKDRLEGAALQPFAQNYVNILRQFGQDGLAAKVQLETAALGVR
jgi:hypothetical protein